MMSMLVGGQEAVGVVNPLPGGTSGGVFGLADAAIFFLADGRVAFYASNNPVHNWYRPTTTGVGSGYWVRFTKQSGDDFLWRGGGSASNWNALSSQREVFLDKNTGGTSVILVEIASDADGNTVVASGTYTLTIS